MSASEDSGVDASPEPSSSLISYQPAHVETRAPALGQSFDRRQPDLESGFRPDIDHDHGSDDSVLPPSDGSHDLDAEDSLDQDDLDELGNPLAGEGSDYTRPNRYDGPASTWRSWTKGDRDVVESLELDRAQNLSMHLYNAYALRPQARRLQESSSRKRRRGTSETDGDEYEHFRAPKVWTAWPMPPNEVPRDRLHKATFDTRPSKNLEECLISTAMKAARERWNAREWENEYSCKQQASADEGDQQTASATDLPDHAEVAEKQVSGSEAFADDEPSPDTLDDTSADETYGVDLAAKPVPLADEDKARHLLLPSTRHVISKLDHLLMALHRARQSYALRTRTDQMDRVASPTTDADGQSSASSRKRCQRSGAPRESSVSTGDTQVSVRTSSPRRRKGVWKEGSVPRNRKFVGLELRDWSDVLGMAALTGWKEDVVGRASKRCAELFGENMLFRSFHEAEHQEEKSFVTERLASGEEPWERAGANLGRISRTQGTDEGEASEMEGEAGLRYPCPIESCRRHQTPFHTAGNLKQHLAHSHAQLGTEDEQDTPIEAAMRDQRQIFCPVQTCHRSREPFMRGSKLYLHVRKMHPEVNVEDLKKLEAQRRGETRGRRMGEKRKRNLHTQD